MEHFIFALIVIGVVGFIGWKHKDKIMSLVNRFRDKPPAQEKPVTPEPVADYPTRAEWSARREATVASTRAYMPETVAPNTDVAGRPLDAPTPMIKASPMPKSVGAGYSRYLVQFRGREETCEVNGAKSMTYSTSVDSINYKLVIYTVADGKSKAHPVRGANGTIRFTGPCTLKIHCDVSTPVWISFQ